MTNHSVVSSLGLRIHVFAHEMILKFGGQKLWRINTDSPNSPKFLTAKVFFRTVLQGYTEANILTWHKRNHIYQVCITSELCYCRLISTKTRAL